MSITYKLAELLDKLVFHSPEVPYWIEIKTDNPACIYYFGHFDSPWAAKLMHKEYIQDLIDEDAKVVSVQLKQCNPQELTIVEAEKEVNI